MFTLSVKGKYGLEAVIYLAANYEAGPIQIREIAQAHEIPQHYLEQILVILKRHGIVKSYRGNQGGYALAENPGKISVLRVLESLEGKLQIVPEDKHEEGLSFFWSRLRTVVEEELSFTLEELAMRKAKDENQVLFVI